MEGNLPRILEEFCAGIRVELHELSIGSNLPRIQGLFYVEVQGLYELLREINLPLIPLEFCAGVWDYTSLPRGAICRGFQKGLRGGIGGTARAVDWEQSATD